MIFRLVWSWYEDYQYYLMQHPNKTNAQFKADAVKAIKEVGKSYIEQEDSWVGVPRWIELASKKLVKDYGYTEPEVGSFGFFGGYILENTPHKDEEVAKWGKIVGKKLLNMALNKNKVIQKEMDKDLDKS